MRLGEQEVYLLFGADKRLFPEPVDLVVQELDERDDESPRMGTANDDTLKKYSANTLGDGIGDLRAGGRAEYEEHEGDKEEGMRRRVAKLIRNGREKVVLAC